MRSEWKVEGENATEMGDLAGLERENESDGWGSGDRWRNWQ